jgi:indole-3-glycerol phosphate synthase
MVPRAEDAAKGVAVVAEVKRASPSKGDIAPDIIAGEQVSPLLSACSPDLIITIMIG